MPPKVVKKVKAATPEPPKAKVKVETKTPTPKKVKEPVVYSKLPKAGDGAIPVDVTIEGGALTAKQKKGGTYAHTIKLEAPASFTLLKTLVFTEGPYEGQQAIVIRPAKAFPFLKLSGEARNLIYDYYFAQKGIVGEPIVLDGKRANKDIYAKTYAEGSKNRVALLAVNKEIHAESTSLLYAHPLKLESTTTLLDFLSQIPVAVRTTHISAIQLKSFIRTSSRNALHFLADCRKLTSLHIESGVACEADVAKAAKGFYGEAYKFLEAMGSCGTENDQAVEKDRGVDVVTFGREALMVKEGKEGKKKPWSEAMVQEFKDELRAKLL